MLAEFYKVPGKLDCLKPPGVLTLENLHYTSFHTWALVFLIGAIIHTLFVDKIHRFARALEAKYPPKQTRQRSIFIQMLYFLAEVEIVFAIWVIPLFFTMAGYYG